jgi:two-component system chemotaxis response regulator CheY
MKTLIVEDDFTARLFLQGLLSRYGDCHIAVNGKEAVEAFRAASDGGEGYNLICMDILMPELDGPGAVQQIRALEEARGIRSPVGVKIIMTTAVEDVKEVFRSFQQLCDAYLVKPVDMNKLLGHLIAFGLV